MIRRFRQDPATISRRLTDGVVVLPLVGDDDPLFLAGTGGELWDALATPRTLDELAEQLAERYEQPAPRIAADIRSVLEDLVAASVVTVDVTDPVTADPPATDPPAADPPVTPASSDTPATPDGP